jgi:hypothetical protein
MRLEAEGSGPSFLGGTQLSGRPFGSRMETRASLLEKSQREHQSVRRLTLRFEASSDDAQDPAAGLGTFI